MLIRDEVNALNIFDLRPVPYALSHFVKTYIDHEKNIKNIDYWIYQNLSSRYSCKKCYNLKNNEIIELIEVGFEDPNELTLFLLACPFI